MKTTIKAIMRLIYGVRGGIKPPLGPMAGTHADIGYRVRFWWWVRVQRLYVWTGLPEDWHKWMER